MSDDDKDFEERFALKVKPDTRMRQVRHFKPSVIQKLKAIKRDMKTSIISTDQFNNKKQKQNKEKKMKDNSSWGQLKAVDRKNMVEKKKYSYISWAMACGVHCVISIQMLNLKSIAMNKAFLTLGMSKAIALPKSL